MFNLEEVRQDQKKRTVSVFVVDKRSRKIVKPAKDMVLRQISSLGVKAQAIIAGASYAFWDILLPTIEEAVALTRNPLENKEYFFRTEYMGRRRTTVSIYEVPSYLRDANLAAYMLQFGDIVSATHDGGGGKAQASCHCVRKETRLLALWRDWSPLRSLPGEEGPEEARPQTWYPPTCCYNEHRKGGSRSLAHTSG